MQPVQGALGVGPPGLLLGPAKVLVLPERGPAEHGVPGAAAEDEADGELDNVQREVGHNGPQPHNACGQGGRKRVIVGEPGEKDRVTIGEPGEKEKDYR